MSMPKEPHHFCQVEPPYDLRWHFEAYTAPSRYLKLFREAKGFKAVGEGSTSNLWHPEVPARIRQRVPQARIIISLRDPIQRAYSHYLMHVREGIQNLPFHEALQEDLHRTGWEWGISHFYVEKGRYAAQVKRYLEVFGPDRVKVILFDQFQRDPRARLLEVVRFLELDPAPVAGIDASKIHNQHRAPRGRWSSLLAGSRLSRMLGETIVPRRLGSFIYERFLLKAARKPPIEPRAREFLTRIYEPEIDELERILKRDLSELRRSFESEPCHPAAATG